MALRSDGIYVSRDYGSATTSFVSRPEEGHFTAPNNSDTPAIKFGDDYTLRWVYNSTWVEIIEQVNLRLLPSLATGYDVNYVNSGSSYGQAFSGKFADCKISMFHR